MVDYFLQNRRDVLSNFQASHVFPLPGEIVAIEDEGRLRVGSPASVSAVKLGNYLRQTPQSEDLQYKVLWNITGVNNSNHILVPCAGLENVNNDNLPNARKTLYPVASGNLGDLTLEDTALIEGEMIGTFLTGSPEPAMRFGFSFNGSQETPEILEMEPGLLHGENFGFGGGPNLLESNFISISSLTCGENCLGYDEEFPWILEWKMMTLGRASEFPFDVAGLNDANVVIWGTIKWGPGLAKGRTLGYYTNPGPYIFDLNSQWTANYSEGGNSRYKRGQQVSNHGATYEALFEHATLVNTGWAPLDYQEYCQRQEPGSGQFWMQFWLKLKQEVEFFLPANVDITRPGLALHLWAGGPYQADKTTVYPDITARIAEPPIGDYTTVTHTGAEQGGTITEGGSSYVARRDVFWNQGVTDDALLPDPVGDPDGRWHRNWRELSADRKDTMKIFGSICRLHGGRSGVGGTVFN